MSYLAIDHLAIYAPDVREAEAFYTDVFHLEVLFREAPTADGWAQVPLGVTWDDAQAAGIDVSISFLARDAFRFAIEKGREPLSTPNQLSHICLFVDANELEHLRQYVPHVGCPLVVNRPSYVQFVDRYGIRWELTSKELTSNGVGNNRWLTVTPTSNISSR